MTIIRDLFVYKLVRVLKSLSVVKMDTNEEFKSSSGTDVVGQLLSTKTSTLALMTTSILLFLTLVAKRLSSKQSEVRKCCFTARRWVKCGCDTLTFIVARCPHPKLTIMVTCADLHIDNLGKNLLLDLQRKLYTIKVRWQVKKGR